RLPSPLYRATAKSHVEPAPGANPATTILPSGWSTLPRTPASPPKSVRTLPPPPNVGSRKPLFNTVRSSSASTRGRNPLPRPNDVQREINSRNIGHYLSGKGEIALHTGLTDKANRRPGDRTGQGLPADDRQWFLTNLPLMRTGISGAKGDGPRRTEPAAGRCPSSTNVQHPAVGVRPVVPC